MKKLIIFVIVLLLLINNSCSVCDDHEFINIRDEFENLLPESSLQYGSLVAENIRILIKTAHKEKLEYNIAKNSEQLRALYYRDVLRIMSNYHGKVYSIDEMSFNYKEFENRISNLTILQIEIINKIIVNLNEAKSYNDVYSRLIAILKEISVKVPPLQRLRLYNVVSVIGLGLKEMEELDKEGISMIHNKYKVMTKAPYEGGDTGWGVNCRKFLAATWSIAVGEPTPVGEIVASVATVLIAGMMLYEIVACSYGNVVDDPSMECYKKYNTCFSEYPDGCGTCLRFCLLQGYWPPYSTHKCSY